MQVAIGVTFRLSARHGNYQFSQASSLVLTEFLKCLIALTLYAREIKRSSAAPGAIKLEASPSLGYSRLPEVDTDDLEDQGPVKHEAGPVAPSTLSPTRQGWLARRIFVRLRQEATTPVLYGFGALAVLYAVNNNTVGT